MDMPAQTATATSNAVSPVPAQTRKPWVQRLVAAFKILYIGCAIFFSIWVASFAPVGHPPLTGFVPPRAGFVVQVHDGAKLMEAVTKSSAAAELYDDPDFNEVSNLKERLDRWKDAPRWVRWVFPYRIETLFPVAGHEMLFAVIVPVAEPPAIPVKKHLHNEQRLLMTQLSGGRGHLLRIIASFVKPKDVEIFDLGGGAMALGYNGAQPVFNRQRLQAGSQPVTLPEGGKQFARLEMYPPILQGKPTEPNDLENSPLEPYLAALTESTVRALVRPPGVPEILNIHETPKEVSLNFFAVSDGIQARGQIVGGVPPLPKLSFDPAGEMPTTQDKDHPPYAEGLLPIDGKAAFFSYVTQQLAQKPPDPEHPNQTRKLSGKQQRLLRQLAGMEDLDIDLDRDLWPMGGGGVRFRVDDLPLEYSQMGYGLVRLSVPLDARKHETRLAAKELIKVGWNVYDRDLPAPKDAKQPYVQEISDKGLDRYVLVNGQGWAPTISISENSLTVTSDAGPYALLETQPSVPLVKPVATKPDAFFIRLDGRRLAASVETIARSEFESDEKDEGSQKFLKEHPHSAAWVELDRKLTGLLGNFLLTVTPTEKSSGDIQLIWKPGTIKVPASTQTGSGNGNAPPPPPPGNDDAPAPPPP